MNLLPPLTTWFCKADNKLNRVAMLFVLFYVLFVRHILHPHDGLMTSLILLHSYLLVASIGKFRSGATGYLYSRGFTRGVLWRRIMIWSAAGVLLVWLPAALAVWTGLRAYLQDLTLNPNFPLFADMEYKLPLLWLERWVFFVAVLHYAWIRQAQPTRCRRAGLWLAALLIFTHIMLHGSGGVQPDIRWIPQVWRLLAPAIAVLLLWRGAKLHNSLEVKVS